MTSLEMVAYINEVRKGTGAVDLRHDSFMVKVPKVLGEMGLQNFLDTYTNRQNGQSYPCYRFPKREACLMAMSYSYDLQAKVFDRMTELEGRQPVTPVPPTEPLADSVRGHRGALLSRARVHFANESYQALALVCATTKGKVAI